MDSDLILVLVALAAVAGGVISALLGWIDSAEPFVARKFLKSLIVAVLTGLTAAVAFELTGEPSARDFILAFLGGAGVDALGNRVGLGRLGEPK